MALPLDAATRAALRAGQLFTGWLIDLFLDEGTERYWNGYTPLSYMSETGALATYQGIGESWALKGELEKRKGLEGASFELFFDSAGQVKAGDPVHELLNKTWHRRRVRVRQVLFTSAGRSVAVGTVEEVQGEIDNIADTLEAGRGAELSVTVESGTFSYLERTQTKRTAETQARFWPGDTGFQIMPKIAGIELPWKSKFQKMPGFKQVGK